MVPTQEDEPGSDPTSAAPGDSAGNANLVQLDELAAIWLVPVAQRSTDTVAVSQSIGPASAQCASGKPGQ